MEIFVLKYCFNKQLWSKASPASQPHSFPSGAGTNASRVEDQKSKLVIKLSTATLTHCTKSKYQSGPVMIALKI